MVGEFYQIVGRRVVQHRRCGIVTNCLKQSRADFAIQTFQDAGFIEHDGVESDGLNRCSCS